VLGTSVVYPHNYGFVPQTMDEDGAALDVLVIMSEKVHPFSFLRAKPVGVVRMTENNRPDSKLIAVHADDPAYRDFGDVHELPAHRLTEISRFLEDYRTFEGRLAGPPVSTPKVSVDGFEDALAARLLLKEAQAAYKAAFLPKRPRTG
jgi:inorganic pyrophosphatase